MLNMIGTCFDSAQRDILPSLRAKRSNPKQGMRSLRKRGTRDDELLRHLNSSADRFRINKK
jgi:hypothetical protein